MDNLLFLYASKPIRQKPWTTRNVEWERIHEANTECSVGQCGGISKALEIKSVICDANPPFHGECNHLSCQNFIYFPCSTETRLDSSICQRQQTNQPGSDSAVVNVGMSCSADINESLEPIRCKHRELIAPKTPRSCADWCQVSQMNGKGNYRAGTVFTPAGIIQGGCDSVFTARLGQPSSLASRPATTNPRHLRMQLGALSLPTFPPWCVSALTARAAATQAPTGPAPPPSSVSGRFRSSPHAPCSPSDSRRVPAPPRAAGSAAPRSRLSSPRLPTAAGGFRAICPDDGRSAPHPDSYERHGLLDMQRRFMRSLRLPG